MGRGGRRPGARGQAKADRRDHRHAPSPRGVPALCRLGCRIHPVAAGVGDGNGAPRGARAASAAGLDRATLRRRRAPIRRPTESARATRGRTWPDRGRTRPGGSRRRRGHQGHGASRDAGASRRRAPSPVRPAVAGSPGPATFARAGGRRRRAGAGGGERRLFGDPARRCHRLRQDGGIFRRDRRRPSPRPANAGVAAGDRPFLTVAGPVQAPVRRRPCGLALGPVFPHAPDHLAGGGRRRRPRRGWSALGIVPAVSRPRPRGGGRGARDGVQAGGRGGVPRPRPRRGARPAVGGARRYSCRPHPASKPSPM